MTVLVTGSAGFIGSNLCHYLISKGEEVVGFDALLAGSDYSNIADCKMYFLNGNLCNPAEVNGVFTSFKIDKVVHLAAQSHVDRSIEDDSVFWQSNVIGTANLMRAAREANVQVVINQITDEFYGEQDDFPAYEGGAPNPTSPYPCSKVAQYFVGKAFSTTYGLPVISTFPVNCFGPRQYPEKIIPKFVRHLLVGERVPLMASTHFERDWLPVQDMCSALYLLLDQGRPNTDYNVGANNHHSNLQLTHKLLDLCSRDKSFIEIVDDRLAHDSRYAVDSSRIRKLGWQPEHSFDDYLAYTVDWYRKKYAD